MFIASINTTWRLHRLHSCPNVVALSFKKWTTYQLGKELFKLPDFQEVLDRQKRDPMFEPLCDHKSFAKCNESHFYRLKQSLSIYKTVQKLPRADGFLMELSNNSLYIFFLLGMYHSRRVSGILVQIL